MDTPKEDKNSEETPDTPTETTNDCASSIPVINFANDVHTLNNEQEALLVCFYATLNLNKLTELRVFGYADDKFTNDYNIYLSIRRAKSVGNFFNALGIPEELLKVYGLGEVAIVNDNAKEMERAFNRKVNFELIHR
jgi:outer membrane protein OmpA-like peptidoglycan-associated protein